MAYAQIEYRLYHLDREETYPFLFALAFHPIQWDWR